MALLILGVEGNPHDRVFLLAGAAVQTFFDLILKTTVLSFVLGIEAIGIVYVIPKEVLLMNMFFKFLIVLL